MTWMWPVSSNGAQVRHRAVRAEAQIDCGSQAIEGDAQGTPPIVPSLVSAPSDWIANITDGPQGAIRIHGVGRDRRAVRGAIHPRERLKRITPGPAVRQSGSARGIRDDEQRRLQGDACSAAAAKIALIMKLR